MVAEESATKILVRERQKDGRTDFLRSGGINMERKLKVPQELKLVMGREENMVGGGKNC